MDSQLIKCIQVLEEAKEANTQIKKTQAGGRSKAAAEQLTRKKKKTTQKLKTFLFL